VALVKRLVLAFSFVVAIVFALQSALPPRGNPGASIQGKVLQESGGQPVRKANLELRTGYDGFFGSGGYEQKYFVTTDAAGRFQIDDVAPGRYAVVIEHPGFAQSRGGRSTIVVLPGQGTTDFVFHMQRAAVITGKIIDLDGDPISDVSVTAHLVGSASRGMRPDESFGAPGTNDLGEFRIPDLRAGRYTLEADPPYSWSHSESEGNAKEQEIYTTTYYPGTLDKAQSVAVEIHAGDETPINFGLLKTRAYRVSGTVLAAPGGEKLRFVRLRPKGYFLDRWANGGPQSSRVGEGGKFEFTNLLPGSYTALLEGSSKSLRLSPTVEVNDADVEGLQLQPDVGQAVRVTFRMDAGLKFDWTQLSVWLVPLDEPDVPLGEPDFKVKYPGFFRPPPIVSQAGTFEVKDVVVGTYQLAALSKNLPDYFIKSVSLGGRDVTDTGFSVSPGMSLDVVIGANGATIEGTVEGGNGKPVAYATVVDIPSVEHRLYHWATTDEHGHFSFRGLNPGKHTVMAFEELPGNPDTIRWLNFLTPYESHGEVVQLQEGTRRSTVLKVIPADIDSKTGD
jgi:Carboxypeptidase regulatory-like domain